MLTSLLSKGLLVKYENQICRLLNESFQSFILYVVKPEEALHFEKESTAGSRWAIFKIPLMIILLALAAFIFLTQQESWVSIIAVLTGVSSLVTLLPRFSFLIPAFILKKEAKYFFT